MTWAPLAGSWKFENRSATFVKPQDIRVPVGVALARGRFRAGTITVTTTFQDPSEAAARVIVGYNAATSAYFSIGLGGYGFAYVIDEYREGRGWKALRANGTADNLNKNTPYAMQVDVQGQSAKLSVDGITVLETTLPYPLSGGQVGLFAWGEKSIKFDDLKFEPGRPRAFVVMQFSEPYNTLYDEVIQPVAKRLNFEVYRADDVFRPGIILQDIVRGLIEADVIIAEITPVNANVFYELGYAHALDKPTILLASRNTQLPFDISGYRCIFYDDTIGGKHRVEVDLERHLKNIEGSTPPVLAA